MFILRKGQHFYKVNRCTLVSLQVEKERLQIFRIINNSLPRCQGQSWQPGSCPQAASEDAGTPTPPTQAGVGAPQASAQRPRDSISSLQPLKTSAGIMGQTSFIFTLKMHLTLQSLNQLQNCGIS